MASHNWQDGRPLNKRNLATNVFNPGSKKPVRLAAGPLEDLRSFPDITGSGISFDPLMLAGKTHEEWVAWGLQNTEPGSTINLSLQPMVGPRRQPKKPTVSASQFAEMAARLAPNVSFDEMLLGLRGTGVQWEQGKWEQLLALDLEAKAKTPHLTQEQHKQRLIDLVLEVRQRTQTQGRRRRNNRLPHAPSMPEILDTNISQSLLAPTSSTIHPFAMDYGNGPAGSGLLMTSVQSANFTSNLGTGMMSHYPMAGLSAANSGMDSHLLNMSLSEATQWMGSMSSMGGSMHGTGNPSSHSMFPKDSMFHYYG